GIRMAGDDLERPVLARHLPSSPFPPRHRRGGHIKAGTARQYVHRSNPAAERRWWADAESVTASSSSDVAAGRGARSVADRCAGSGRGTRNMPAASGGGSGGGGLSTRGSPFARGRPRRRPGRGGEGGRFAPAGLGGTRGSA